MRNKPKLYPPPGELSESEALERAWAKLKALGVNGYAPGTWEEELALCEKERVAKLWSELRSERNRAYKRRFKERHPERLRATNRIYLARWKAKLLGLPPPPLLVKAQYPPDPIEVPFDY